ncbi:glycosyl hydrolase 115 family protein [Muricauda sp. CAU 1633]|uniref:glycosyl hydrolase 115 family protein n=1 Tax=Allomuricauda sp. CAU 1633 TaxID=2816036 RepID=UPI001A8D0ADF|nr:glycosyl hydrolase 115 family protein [Muricauda sp. CAU 1633]MBO0323245.1 glycosyl hydrolase 115 family protein [Muricauda sp. CAU 1633]
MRKLFLGFLLCPLLSIAQLQVSNIRENKQQFALVNETSTATILYDASDEVLVHKAASFLASDIEKVTGKKSEPTSSSTSLGENLVIIGTIGKSKFIDELIASKKIDVRGIEGQWERFLMQTVKNPYPGVSQALVIAGSDKRGTAYGVFSLSKEIGVSPWHFWADVPAKQRDAIYVNNGKYVSKTPSVKYRGIFLNDEAPALRGWAEETFGGFNHQFYEKVFELLLRNKANYLWPAMWQPSAFADDDPENARVADEYGIVISTSHHEPMMRAHDEWGRYNGGAWNYETNKEKLQEFWRGGIERMGHHESVVTLGMRGDGDEAMSEETAVDLLKTIIADQREIIKDVTGKPAEETPQVWAIYKEVQDYYDKGLRVDDDILVLYCDDNWGNVRILPKKEDLNHSGGYGMYYHFDFVGGPVSYRWLNVTQLERTWEQMNLSYEWGVKDLWIVNVGDLKPMELPISFFLEFAWDTDAIRAKDLPNYYVNWAKQQFGEEYAQEIAEILSLYTKYNARRTPEMLKPDTYSLFNYREAETIVDEYNNLLEKSKVVYNKLPEQYKSAFYQLALSPVELCSNLNEMYVAAGKNALYGQQGRASTNMYGDSVKDLFFKDEALTKEFHEELEDGKWNHIMAQTHIGYTSWNNPQYNKMPSVSYLQNNPKASLGYVVEHGTRTRWNTTGLFSQSFSNFDPINDQSYYLEIFNQGEEELSYTLTPKDAWVQLSSTSGTIKFEEKVYVNIDWDKAPQGESSSEIAISGGGREFTVKVPTRNDIQQASGFVENNGVISINAAHFSKKNDTKNIQWTVVPNLGRTDSSIMVEPANAEQQSPESAPSVSYEFTVFDEAELAVETYLSPTLNYKKNEGLKYAIAIDDEAPHIVNIHEGETQPDWEYPDWWNDSVTDHIKKKRTEHQSIKSGKHTLKIWMVDPGVVFQKFVLDLGGLKPSYLGPPESKMVGGKK